MHDSRNLEIEFLLASCHFTSDDNAKTKISVFVLVTLFLRYNFVHGFTAYLDSY